MKMMMMSGWMRAGMVAAMMVATGAAGAQTSAEDAAKAADAQAQVAARQADMAARAAKIEADVQSQVAAQQADMAAQMAVDQADVQAQVAKAQAEIERAAPQLAKLGALNSAQLAKMQAQMARMAPLQAEMQARMAPMEAKLQMSMVPLQAEMLARSAVMQAHMMTHGLMLQDGMVSVGDPQVKDELFAGTEKFAAGASDVTDVNLGPDMLGMVSGKHGGDMAHKLNFMVVRTYEYPRPGMYKMEDVEVYRQKLRAGNWNCFIHTHESKSGESTDICNRALPNNEGNEMVILTVEPQELTFIHMSGKGSLADLSKMGRMGGMGGVVIPDPPDPPAPPAPPAAPHP
jgi:hypothetical protein